MKCITISAAVLLILFSFSVAGFAADQPPTKEPAGMKTLRHKAENLRIEVLNLLVKQGKLDKATADYRIARIKDRSKFKDSNPEWVKFRRPMMCKGKRGRRGNRRGMKQGRMGRRGGCMMMKGRRGRRRGPGRLFKKLYRGVKVETAELRTIRHKGEQLRIARIKMAAKYGRFSADLADYRIKRIQANSKFKDSHPEWVQHNRYGRHGRMGRRDRMGRRGCRR